MLKNYPATSILKHPMLTIGICVGFVFVIVVISSLYPVPTYALKKPDSISGDYFDPPRAVFEFPRSGLLLTGNHNIASITLTKEFTRYDEDLEVVNGEIGYKFIRQEPIYRAEVAYIQNVSIDVSDLPQTFYFNISFTEPGRYFMINYAHYTTTTWPGDGAYNSIDVVESPSKALKENGYCKTSGLLPMPKPDFSTIICISESKRQELIERGW